ncbi:MAG: hypothetical protein LQ341_001563, partial [Variospora aurantia]
MHLLKSTLTLVGTLATSTLAADCDGRLGGILLEELLAANQQLYNSALLAGGFLAFQANDEPKTFTSGETNIAIRHAQIGTPGNVDASEIILAVDQIEQECVRPHVTAPGGRGWGGEVKDIQGQGAADGTFIVMIYQFAALDSQMCRAFKAQSRRLLLRRRHSCKPANSSLSNLLEAFPTAIAATDTPTSSTIWRK